MWIEAKVKYCPRQKVNFDHGTLSLPKDKKAKDLFVMFRELEVIDFGRRTCILKTNLCYLRWVGNGECFLFSIQPKMAIFHSTGKVNEYQRRAQKVTDTHLHAAYISC